MSFIAGNRRAMGYSHNAENVCAKQALHIASQTQRKLPYANESTELRTLRGEQHTIDYTLMASPKNNMTKSSKNKKAVALSAAMCSETSHRR